MYSINRVLRYHQKENKHEQVVLGRAHEKGGNEYMGKLTFKGGIHPYEGKELAKNQPVEKYLPKGDMVYLMSAHWSSICSVCQKR